VQWCLLRTAESFVVSLAGGETRKKGVRSFAENRGYAPAGYCSSDNLTTARQVGMVQDNKKRSRQESRYGRKVREKRLRCR